MWEMRGGAATPEVRNIDDMLVSEQNATAGYQPTHIPMTVDAVAAQTRRVRERFPHDRLKGHPSDFVEAYKQVPEEPSEVEDIVLAQWSPSRRCPEFWLPLSLLFGGRLAPLGLGHPRRCGHLHYGHAALRG